MRELVFMLEEASAKACLESLLPRLLDPRIAPRLVAFEGKQDLEKQLVKRLRGYINPKARFIVMRDQDNAPDCKRIKSELLDLCHLAGRQSVSLVRIACRELETFYLADLQAVEATFGLPGLALHQGKRRFRQPDALGSPGRELALLTRGGYQKVNGSRLLGKLLDLENERSSSFKNLMQGIRKMEANLLGMPDVDTV